MNILITGSGGLIGSEAVEYYGQKDFTVYGIDNNMRRLFFGLDGDVSRNIERQKNKLPNYHHFNIDIRDRATLKTLFQKCSFARIIHCAAQPSHEKAREFPFVDFDINALGTINLLEMTRRYSPDAIFIHMSTNKVYGNSPNEIPLKELESRWEYANEEDYDGITEYCPIDQTIHSLFGASKVAADIMAQEYGRYFGLKVGVFRGGCIVGPYQQGAKLHGFLSYLIKSAVRGNPYKIFGYKGKQVRDLIHSHDVVQAFEAFCRNPHPGEVYNIGGGRDNSVSILEAIALIEQFADIKLVTEYNERNRIGDHICYITNLNKLRTHFPKWTVAISLPDIVEQIIKAEFTRSLGT